MPFIRQIVESINGHLKDGSLKSIQPLNLLGLSTTIGRIKDPKRKKDVEILPAIIDPTGSIVPITPDEKYGIQAYHKLISKGYSYVPKSVGDNYDIKMLSELNLVLLTNSKITGDLTEALEPLIIFGMPERLSSAMLTELRLRKCLITPVASNMDQVTVFRQEYPQSNYFLNNQMSMFNVRYRIELLFDRACINACVCPGPA